jgi:hypothetical protein
VYDFYKFGTPFSDGMCLILQDANLHIAFISGGDYFIISIDAHGFLEWRPKAEQAFLTVLGISKEDACRLQLRMITPRWANPDYADNDYPLSFCENP